MSRKEVPHARVLQEVIEGRIMLKNAQEYLGVSYRQAKRLKSRFVEADLMGLVHGNRGNTPFNALSSSL